MPKKQKQNSMMQTLTAVDTKTKVGLGVGALVCLGLLAFFGNMAMQGLFPTQVISPTITNCSDATTQATYSCVNGQVSQKLVSCISCVNGICINPPVCTDSDISSDQIFPYISGQSDPYIKGVTTGLINGVAATKTDVCYDYKQLTEYYCSNGTVADTGITCEYGCINGACVRPPVVLQIGDIFKADQTQKEICYYGSDKKKHIFPDLAIYNTWYKDFSNIKTVSLDTFYKIPLGSEVSIRPIGYIATITSVSPALYYMVFPNHTVQKFESEAVIEKLFGLNWRSRVIDSGVKLPYINNGIIAANSKLPGGTLFSYAGSDKIYYQQNGNKRLFLDRSIFDINGLTAYDWMIVKNVPATMTFPNGADIIGQEAVFVKPWN